MGTVFNTAKEIVKKIIDSYRILSDVPIFVVIFACVIAAYFVFSYVYNTYVKYVFNADTTATEVPLLVLKSIAYLINGVLSTLTLCTLFGSRYIFSILVLVLVAIAYVIMPKIIFEKEQKQSLYDGYDPNHLYTFVYKRAYFWFFIVVSGLIYILKILFVFVF